MPQKTETAKTTPTRQATTTPQATPTPQTTPTPHATPTSHATPTPRVNQAPWATPTAPTSQQVTVPIASAQRKVAYFTQWGVRVHNYTVKDVDTSGAASKLTAINYAFAGISSDLKCQSADPKADYQEPFTDTVSGQADSNDPRLLAGNFNQLKELKTKYKNLKILISIGGWTLSGQFSNAAKPQNVQSFVKSCIDMFIKGNIPGLALGPQVGSLNVMDIDWKNPLFH